MGGSESGGTRWERSLRRTSSGMTSVSSSRILLSDLGSESGVSCGARLGFGATRTLLMTTHQNPRSETLVPLEWRDARTSVLRRTVDVAAELNTDRTVEGL
jgi:hypothetical protein